MASPYVKTVSRLVGERAELARLLRVMHPKATHLELAKMIERARPDLIGPDLKEGSKRVVIANALKLADEVVAEQSKSPLWSIETAKIEFIERLDDVFFASMRSGRYNEARQAARDKAKVLGVDVDRPIRIIGSETEVDMSTVPTEVLAQFVSALSPEDRLAVEESMPDVLNSESSEVN